MSPAILFATNFSLAGGALGTFSQAIALCQSQPAHFSLGCNISVPYLRYVNVDQIPPTLDPASPVFGVDGTQIFPSWEAAALMTNQTAPFPPGPAFWWGDLLNCEDWSNPDSCGQGVVVDPADSSQSRADCGTAHPFYCLCLGGAPPAPTLAPTRSPTRSPTTPLPTASPTPCVFHTVQCCFSLNEHLVQVFLGDQDVTSHVVPQDGFTNRSVTKTLTFTEPSSPAVLAFKGYDNNELVLANMMLRCQSTNPASKWNFASRAGTGPEGWKAVESATVTGDDLPACWYCLSFTSPQSPAAAFNDTKYIINDVCGAPNTTERVRAAQGGNPAHRFWGLKRLVNQTVSCLVTPSPTVPTRSPTTAAPTRFPTAVPTSSPTCEKPAFVDIVWLLEASTSVEFMQTAMKNVTDFIGAFTDTVTMSEQHTRQGFLLFAGPLTLIPDSNFTTIGRALNVTDSAAANATEFVSVVSSLVTMGGTTNTAGAVDYVREHMFTPENKRPGSHRIVILITDGNPTDEEGDETVPGPIAATNAAVTNLRAEDDVIFVFLKTMIAGTYSESFLQTEANYVYESTYRTLMDLIGSTFLCFKITDAPTPAPGLAPTRSPTLAPTASPTASPTPFTPDPLEYAMDVTVSDGGWSCALTNYARVVCLGSNVIGGVGWGERGESSGFPSDVLAGPVLVPGTQGATKLFGNMLNTTALLPDGSFKTWGIDVQVPLQLNHLLEPVRDLVFHNANAYVLFENGTLVGLGDPTGGALGDPDPDVLGRTEINEWITNTYASDFTIITMHSGVGHFGALASGGVIGWGNYADRPGLEGPSNNYEFSYINADRRVAMELTCTGAFCGAIFDGELWTWGNDNYGTLGTGETHEDAVTVPQQAAVFGTVTHFGFTGYGTCCVALLGAGVQCVGNMLVEDGTEVTLLPVVLEVPGVVVGIRTSLSSLCWLRQGESPLCIGASYYGELTGAAVNRPEPTEYMLLAPLGYAAPKATKVVVSPEAFSCALVTGYDDPLTCRGSVVDDSWGVRLGKNWGQPDVDATGQVGTASVMGVDGLNATALYPSLVNTAAFMSNGTLFTWGDARPAGGAAFQLPSDGNGGFVTVVKFSFGDTTQCLVDTFTDLYCRGNNLNGNLGKASLTDAFYENWVRPEIDTARDVIVVTDSGVYIAGLDGGVYVWGEAFLTSGLEPYGPGGVVLGDSHQVVAMAEESASFAAVTSTGELYVWGYIYGEDGVRSQTFEPAARQFTLPLDEFDQPETAINVGIGAGMMCVVLDRERPLWCVGRPVGNIVEQVFAYTLPGEIVSTSGSMNTICWSLDTGDTYCVGYSEFSELTGPPMTVEVPRRYAPVQGPMGAPPRAEFAVDASPEPFMDCVLTNRGRVICNEVYSTPIYVYEAYGALKIVSAGVRLFSALPGGRFLETNRSPSTPSRLSVFAAEIVHFDATANVQCVVLATGLVHCTGKNHHRQLGDPSRTESGISDWVQVVHLESALLVAVAGNTVCATSSAGGIYCWGNSESWGVTAPAGVFGMPEGLEGKLFQGLECADQKCYATGLDRSVVKWSTGTPVLQPFPFAATQIGLGLFNAEPFYLTAAGAVELVGGGTYLPGCGDDNWCDFDGQPDCCDRAYVGVRSGEFRTCFLQFKSAPDCITA